MHQIYIFQVKRRLTRHAQFELGHTWPSRNIPFVVIVRADSLALKASRWNRHRKINKTNWDMLTWYCRTVTTIPPEVFGPPPPKKDVLSFLAEKKLSRQSSIPPFCNSMFFGVKSDSFGSQSNWETLRIQLFEVPSMKDDKLSWFLLVDCWEGIYGIWIKFGAFKTNTSF